MSTRPLLKRSPLGQTCQAESVATQTGFGFRAIQSIWL